MKIIIFVLLGFLVNSVHAQSECNYKIIDSTGITVVLPVYKAKVLYYFDDFERKAMAQVQWGFDSDASSNCMKAYEARYPGVKLSLADINVPVLKVEVFKGTGTASLSVLPEQGGQFHGQTDFIPVNYMAKSEIIKAVNEKKELITMHGKLFFQYEMLKKDVLTHFECVRNEKVEGVLALHTRLNEIILQVNGFNTKQKVSLDLVLEDFLGACVEIKEVESSDLLGLARKVKLINGKVPVYGYVKSFHVESTFPFHTSEPSFIEF